MNPAIIVAILRHRLRLTQVGDVYTVLKEGIPLFSGSRTDVIHWTLGFSVAQELCDVLEPDGSIQSGVQMALGQLGWN